MLEEKINCQDLMSLLEETKEKVKEAGLLCDTIMMHPKVYDLVMAALKDLSGVEKTPVSCTMYLGLKLVKNDRVPENMVFFTQRGELKRIEKWDMWGKD